MSDLPESSKSIFAAIGPKIETTNEPSEAAKQWELLTDGDYEFLERLAVNGGWLYRTGYGPRNLPPFTVCMVFVPDVLAPDREIATPSELLTRAKNQWADACIERDAAREEVVRLRSTLRDTIAALDVAAIALDAAGDKLAASVATVAIGNARKGLGDE